jgi:hypothetical protein
MEIKQHTVAWLRRRRTTLEKQLSTADHTLIRGSLVESYKRCGKGGCKCMQGKGHGPKYYLTQCLGKGKLDTIYVPLQQVDKVRAYKDNYQKLQAALKELGDINRELLRRKEAF